MSSLTDDINGYLQNAGPTPENTAPPEDKSLRGQINRTLSGNPVPPGAPPPIPPATEPSFWENTKTAVGRGVGGLMSMTQPEAAMYMTQAGANPDELGSPGQIRQKGEDYITGGKPYIPQTFWGDVYQNGLSNSIEGLPYSMLGGAGGLTGRILANAGSSFGGEIGKKVLPNHPEIGSLLGALSGGAVGGGLNLPSFDTMSSAVKNAPSMIKNFMTSSAWHHPGVWMPMLTATEGGMLYPEQASRIYNAVTGALSSPEATASALLLPAYRGLRNFGSTAQGTVAGLIPHLLRQLDYQQQPQEFTAPIPPASY